VLNHVNISIHFAGTYSLSTDWIPLPPIYNSLSNLIHFYLQSEVAEMIIIDSVRSLNYSNIYQFQPN